MNIFLAFSSQDALVSERRCGGRPDITASFESNDTLWKLILLSSLQTDLRCMQKTTNRDQVQGVHIMHFVHSKCGKWVFPGGLWVICTLSEYSTHLMKFPEIFYRYYLNELLAPIYFLMIFIFRSTDYTGAWILSHMWFLILPIEPWQIRSIWALSVKACLLTDIPTEPIIPVKTMNCRFFDSFIKMSNT